VPLLLADHERDDLQHEAGHALLQVHGFHGNDGQDREADPVRRERDGLSSCVEAWADFVARDDDLGPQDRGMLAWGLW
jgi:hypothetical protein